MEEAAPRTSRPDAACRDVPRVQPHFSAAFCRSASQRIATPLRGVVHTSQKPSRLRDIARKLCFFDLMKFLFTANEEVDVDDDIAPHEVANSATARSIQ